MSLKDEKEKLKEQHAQPAQPASSAAAPAAAAAAAAPTGAYAELRVLFDKLDKNGNGTVGKKEWGKSLSANREAMAKFFGGETMAQIGKQFNRIDADKSGDLTWEEVKAAVKIEVTNTMITAKREREKERVRAKDTEKG